MGLTWRLLHSPSEFTNQRVQQLFLGNVLAPGLPLPSGPLQLWALGTRPSSFSLHCFHPGWARGWSISKELIPAPALLISRSVEPWSGYLIALL